MMTAAQQAAFELYEKEAAKNPAFKKIYGPWGAVRDEVLLWHRVAEMTFANIASNPPPPAMQ
jgi:TRAP-type mannitol/chloroaromatic compound transport system substrate-binding protein